MVVAGFVKTRMHSAETHRIFTNPATEELLTLSGAGFNSFDRQTKGNSRVTMQYRSLFALPGSLGDHGNSSGRIIAARVPRMTPANSNGAFAETSNQAKFLYRQNEILAAGGIETATSSQPWTDQILVQLDRTNRQKSRNLQNPPSSILYWRRGIRR